MKHLLKLPVILFLLPLLSSCFSHKDITKKIPVSADVLSKLEPGKRYRFELKSGNSMRILVQSVGDGKITGYSFQPNIKGREAKVDFLDTFNNLEKNVSKIYLRKFNPYLTTAAIVIPIGLTIVVLTAPLYSFTIGVSY